MIRTNISISIILTCGLVRQLIVVTVDAQLQRCPLVVIVVEVQLQGRSLVLLMVEAQLELYVSVSLTQREEEEQQNTGSPHPGTL